MEEIIIDYDYYLDNYGGEEIDEEVFEKLLNKSQAIITSLITNPCLIKNNIDAYNNAVCAQIEYMASGDYKKILSGNDANNLQSESYPNYSYTKSDSNNIFSVNGITISPLSIVYLKNAGLLYRGVGYVI